MPQSYILIYLKQQTIQEPWTQFNFHLGDCALKQSGEMWFKWASFFLFVLSVARHVGNMILCPLLLSAAGNPFHKDHQGEKSQGAGNTSTLDASGPSASGSQSSPPAQTESFSFHPEELWARAETRQKSSSKSLRKSMHSSDVQIQNSKILFLILVTETLFYTGKRDCDIIPLNQPISKYWREGGCKI